MTQTLEQGKMISLTFWDKIVEKFPGAIAALVILIIGWWIAGLITKAIVRILNKTKVDPVILSFLVPSLKIVFRIVVIILALSKLGVNVSAIITALGASLVTIGLALKDSLSNIASGTLIIINKPFSMGDYLEISGVKGTITKIELMFTTLMTPENNVITIPNSKVLSSVIINYKNPKTIEEAIIEKE